jgi:hypothetical protein
MRERRYNGTAQPRRTGAVTAYAFGSVRALFCRALAEQKRAREPLDTKSRVLKTDASRLNGIDLHGAWGSSSVFVRQEIRRNVGMGIVPYRTVRRPIFPSDEWFWRTATVVALAAVLCLLLGASVHRLSPLPGGLSLSSGSGSAASALSENKTSRNGSGFRSEVYRDAKPSPFIS